VIKSFSSVLSQSDRDGQTQTTNVLSL